MTSKRNGYRLRLSIVRRWLTVGLLGLIGLFFASAVASSVLDVWWRLFGVLGVVSAVIAIRIVLGPAIVVRDQGLRLQRNWPIRRDIPWYRILEIDVIPGFWNLEIELNSGERISLPCVERVDDLYEDLEAHRQALDA